MSVCPCWALRTSTSTSTKPSSASAVARTTHLLLCPGTLTGWWHRRPSPTQPKAWSRWCESAPFRPGTVLCWRGGGGVPNRQQGPLSLSRSRSSLCKNSCGISEAFSPNSWLKQITCWLFYTEKFLIFIFFPAILCVNVLPPKALRLHLHHKRRPLPSVLVCTISVLLPMLQPPPPRRQPSCFRSTFHSSGHPSTHPSAHQLCLGPHLGGTSCTHSSLHRPFSRSRGCC